MGCKGMTQNMRGQSFLYTRFQRISFNYFPTSLPSQATPSHIDEKRLSPFRFFNENRASFPYVCCTRFHCTAAERDDPLLAPFSENTDKSHGNMNIIHIQADQLTDAHPCAIKQFKQGNIPLPLRFAALR